MNHQTRVYESMLEMLSNAENPTPLVRIQRVSPFKHAKVYAKLEWYNPFGAVKDRVAAHLLEDAEQHGRVAPGIRLVEPTSGNTGMGLAMLANAKGYRFTATMSNKVPLEKRASLRIFGTDLIELDDDLCPAPGAPEGALARAADLGNEPGSFHLNQYKNWANPEAHFRTTGPEIWRQTEGKVTHFFAGTGTCGTVTGTGRFLKSKRPDVKVFAVIPVEGHDIPGVRSLKQLKQTNLFVPNEYDGMVEIDNKAAYALTKRLNQEESIIAAPSSAMALEGAFRCIPDEEGVVAVVIFPDNIFKYTSSMQKHLPELFASSSKSQQALPQNLNPILEFARASPDVLDPVDAQAHLASSGAVLIDVRGRDEFAGGHVPGAINRPLPDIVGGYADVPADKAKPIVTFCKVGERSLHALLLLKAMGHTNVKSVRGGITAWSAASLPTTTE
jgi:cysteine synthase/rhodanese-related sulfurtransferase